MLIALLFLAVNPELVHAQNDNRVPFKHRVGNTPPEDNVFHIRGDFTMIGNTNLTLAEYSKTGENSLAKMKFVDVDGDPKTFNSSSATLMFSQENGAAPNCTEILYAGLYWAGKSDIGQGLNFDLTKTITSEELKEVKNEEQVILPYEEINHSSFTMTLSLEYDENGLIYPIYYFWKDEEVQLILIFPNDQSEKALYQIGEEDWQEVENQSISTAGELATATFDPIMIEDNGFTFSIHTIKRSLVEAFRDVKPDDFTVEWTASGSYYPDYPHTVMFDKRKVKLKAPGASNYTEISSQGNSILFPHNDMEDMYVGYADVTDLVKSYGAGEYTVADVALVEGLGNNTGYFGNWGMIVVYQNSKMDWRNISIFDGYSYVQSLDKEEHVGEIEITGFETIKQGDVKLKLGVMAAEGDKSIKGDYLQILNQNKEWVLLSHKLAEKNNFFNSSIYTPVRDAEGNLIDNPRNPQLEHNTGTDIVQWEVPNPENAIIANEQRSFRFRFGTNQDQYAIFAFAFSVPSYVPEIQAHNQIKYIEEEPPGEEPSVEPGQEITYTLDIKNLGTEASLENKIVIPLPITATFVSANSLPQDHGAVTFDPDLGIAGAIVWEIGEIPLQEDSNDTAATLEYTLKLTEDCFYWANNSCEVTMAIDGSMSGLGSISGSSYSNIPFFQGFTDDACVGEAIYGPIEIPIVGKAEFAATHCIDQVDFPSIGPIQLPDFCQGDAPIELGSLISPSQEGFSIYFFTEEEGGEGFTNYQVNTSLSGSEQIWVAEGPQETCTGIRTPLSINVLMRAPTPIVKDLIICQLSETNTFSVQEHLYYQLNYYLDNDPQSIALANVPQINTEEVGVHKVWVSYSLDGKCESHRTPVQITVEDCSYRPSIQIEKYADVENYSQINDTINYTLVVTNPRKVPLFNVTIYDELTSASWDIPYFEVLESETFTTSYVINNNDLSYGAVQNFAYATGQSQNGEFIQDMAFLEVEALIFPDGFLDHEISVSPEACTNDDIALGTIEIQFPSHTPQTGTYILKRKADGQEYSGEFQNRIRVQIAVPHGEYSLSITDEQENTFNVKGLFLVDKRKFVDFTIPEEITTCYPHMLTPKSTMALTYRLKAPSGATVWQNSQEGFDLSESGLYHMSATDKEGILCSVEKSFYAEISQPQNTELDLAPFCREDVFTTLSLQQDPDNLKVNWYRVRSQDAIHLSDYDNNPTLTVQEAGLYEVTLTNEDGCMVGRGQMEVVQSFSEMPPLQALYSICLDRNLLVLIDAGNNFSMSQWLLDGITISTGSTFSPTHPGNYSLLAIDEQGCEFFVDFEVEDVCNAMVSYPTAILPGDSQRPFLIYPNNLATEMEVFIHNRWGEMIFYCEDKNPQANQPSTCIWDGFYNNQKIPGGNYSVIIQYKNKKDKLLTTEKGMITVIE
ncbi:hypothetical protein CQA01_47270 [Cyclobacterium qasimii]|uniref:DUF7507 domain-containing protein n=2 Tax=Cyclobacterium qasimii TaxID=1350429 RepID=A0A512CJ06_9BACT|nr:hypothetical protein CQA01_47270 [Cyclobacterium qasimii]